MIIPIVYPKILPTQGVRHAIQPSWDFSIDCESPPTVIYVFNVTTNSDGTTADIQTFTQPEEFTFFDRLAPISYICPAQMKYGKNGQCCLVSREPTSSGFSSAMLISGSSDFNASHMLFPVSSNLASYCRIVSLDTGQALFGFTEIFLLYGQCKNGIRCYEASLVVHGSANCSSPTSDDVIINQAGSTYSSNH